ncbi:MAG: hypothetical protein ACRDIB_00155, partial [Ardenticatenaceae bacterium]
IRELPDDPAMLAFAVAMFYQGQNWRKQELLATEVLPDILYHEIELLRVENPIIAQTLRLREEEHLPPLALGAAAAYGFN